MGQGQEQGQGLNWWLVLFDRCLKDTSINTEQARALINTEQARAVVNTEPARAVLVRKSFPRLS